MSSPLLDRTAGSRRFYHTEAASPSLLNHATTLGRQMLLGERWLRSVALDDLRTSSAVSESAADMRVCGGRQTDPLNLHSSAEGTAGMGVPHSGQRSVLPRRSYPQLAQRPLLLRRPARQVARANGTAAPVARPASHVYGTATIKCVTRYFALAPASPATVGPAKPRSSAKLSPFQTFTPSRLHEGGNRSGR